MSIHYCSSLKENPLSEYQVASQEAVVYHDKIYEVWTYRIPRKWFYCVKNIFKIFRDIVSLKIFNGADKIKSYFFKAFLSHRLKQVVVPRNSECEGKAEPVEVDLNSRLGRILYWNEIVRNGIRRAEKSIFLSKHFSKIPAMSNFEMICLMPVWATRSTVPFQASGDFEQIYDEITSKPKGKVLTLFYSPLETKEVISLLKSKRFLKGVLKPSSYYEVHDFKFYGLAQSISLPLPQELVEMVVAKPT